VNNELHAAIEDIVYAWSIQGLSIDRLVDDLHDFVVEAYGPPF